MVLVTILLTSATYAYCGQRNKRCAKKTKNLREAKTYGKGRGDRSAKVN